MSIETIFIVTDILRALGYGAIVCTQLLRFFLWDFGYIKSSDLARIQKRQRIEFALIALFFFWVLVLQGGARFGVSPQFWFSYGRHSLVVPVTLLGLWYSWTLYRGFTGRVVKGAWRAWWQTRLGGPKIG